MQFKADFEGGFSSAGPPANPFEKGNEVNRRNIASIKCYDRVLCKAVPEKMADAFFFEIPKD